MLVRVFVMGMLAVIPAALLERPLRFALIRPDAYSLKTITALVVIGLIEEGVKFLAAYVTVFNSPHFDEVEDGIVYAITAALGFAVVENALYTLAFGTNVVLVRAVITSVAHASFAGIFGLYLGLYRMGRVATNDLLRGYLLAAAFHALYDLLVSARPLSPVFGVLLVAAVYRYVVMKLRGTVSS